MFLSRRPRRLLNVDIRYLPLLVSLPLSPKSELKAGGGRDFALKSGRTMKVLDLDEFLDRDNHITKLINKEHSFGAVFADSEHKFSALSKMRAQQNRKAKYANSTQPC
ncbi:hypothetical protein GE21DRAFT_8808 [Neurospora crassa]|uniref:Uncharacterized protein n=1 Tax=Neurospora crassa (strain ATCC 24698 / 74-OR23-1A / CBS 708.71 / DSM 1257 / FGSC 987) TaxID=367110 RepID=Q7S6L3_NEUCR|nr:hypothetical protein NCU04822 [Neurospora crassa OR74A]EAA31145.1 hypothetical protein NCU04822 [Neurospora crassa OR74A]KHE89025.1 hypothetical protein GE21DRAFT_8808 [Neurospora crassa]|eukprot:XP_960381.1 hypothetical protein NCU04822 [Neurospora crassa OR74A]